MVDRVLCGPRWYLCVLASLGVGPLGLFGGREEEGGRGDASSIHAPSSKDCELLRERMAEAGEGSSSEAAVSSVVFVGLLLDICLSAAPGEVDARGLGEVFRLSGRSHLGRLATPVGRRAL